MNFYVVSDWYLNHDNIKTYCQRPENFTELIVKRHNETVTDKDTVIMLGDVAIGKKSKAIELIKQMKGRKILVRGNHDRDKSCTWWMEAGQFHFACDSFKFRNILFTHEPYVPQYDDHLTPKNEDQPRPYQGSGVISLPAGCEYNVHGHLHNIWDGFAFNGGNHGGVTPIINLATGQPFDKPTKLWYPWQRLFALEYTDYKPVEIEKFLANPERYQATGPKETK